MPPRPCVTVTGCLALAPGQGRDQGRSSFLACRRTHCGLSREAILAGDSGPCASDLAGNRLILRSTALSGAAAGGAGAEGSAYRRRGPFPLLHRPDPVLQRKPVRLRPGSGKAACPGRGRGCPHPRRRLLDQPHGRNRRGAGHGNAPDSGMAWGKPGRLLDGPALEGKPCSDRMKELKATTARRKAPATLAQQ
jgi:hypothetical protein